MRSFGFNRQTAARICLLALGGVASACMGGEVEDAGAEPDAVTSDAGASDAGTDAGAADAGPDADAGTIDGGEIDAGPRCTEAQKLALETEMDLLLAAAPSDTPDLTYAVEVPGVASYIYSRGNSTLQTEYESASSSKWVVAAVVLRLVDQNLSRNGHTFTLESRPQDFIPGWTIHSDNPLYDITLAQLLSFTSGLHESPGCVFTGLLRTFDECVLEIGNANAGSGRIPGQDFYYTNSHLQVAGAMAIAALGVSTWTEVFDNFKSETGLFSGSNFDLPSLSNPRLAGGMHWTGSQYLEFERRMFAGTLLSAPLQAAMFSDQIAGLAIVSSPLDRIDEEWHYGFGGWIECASETFDCTEVTRVSCPGAFGAYPFIDVEEGYLGILSRQGSTASGPQAIEFANTITPQIREWARCVQSM